MKTGLSELTASVPLLLKVFELKVACQLHDEAGILFSEAQHVFPAYTEKGNLAAANICTKRRGVLFDIVKIPDEISFFQYGDNLSALLHGDFTAANDVHLVEGLPFSDEYLPLVGLCRSENRFQPGLLKGREPVENPAC